jgi:hypothetical protein
MSAWTAWGVAYRYPGEDEPEPSPDELFKALDIVGQAAIELWSLAPLEAGGAGKP